MMFGEVVHETVKKFPVDERFELRSQFMRAADSIALNIAEGAFGTDAQFNNFLGHALYSSNEGVSFSTKARLRSYITYEEFEQNIISIINKNDHPITTKNNQQNKSKIQHLKPNPSSNTPS